jgi:hypothetical protein
MLDRRHHLLALGHIGDEHRGLASQGHHLGGHGVELGAIDIDQGDIGTVPCQAQRDGAANALPGAGHQRDLSSDNVSSGTHDDLLQR